MLRAVAYRLLGSRDEAEDAVQEAWIRLGRSDADGVDNLPGWLRTVVTRICLDMLRSRGTRREEPADAEEFDRVPDPGPGARPEEQALLADSVSRALLVVLDTLAPAERVAFVLHDMFAVPFEQIAPLVGRSPSTAKKLASRARHKVRGTPVLPAAELARHRTIVAAFLDAARAGDLTGVLAVLAPDVVRRADPAALPPGAPREVRGARAVAEGTLAFAHRSRAAEIALVDGAVGLLVAPHGRLVLAVAFTIEGDRITAYDVIADRARLRTLRPGVLDEPSAGAR
ncbi:sigma-70 family RNA polymerase sigma factor [Yinghuangia sp. ASG 101]|nr:sigma-70 family RNA polymerase sigma factor [Yinghuangia sp. ASG 101]UGQ15279.1 sigma-70 family RNA polymerase sigma factor [Yinghuangia sp. ASG 101]